MRLSIMVALMLALCQCGCGQSVTLTGTGVTPTAPAMRLSTSAVAFGDVTLGSTATQNIVVSSTGTAPLIITAVTVTVPEFVVSGLTVPTTLQPSATTQLTVTFDPTIAGSVSGSLTIVSNAFTSPVQAATLTGAAIVAGNGVGLTWQEGASPDPVASYTVYRAVSGSFIFYAVQSGITSLAYTDTTAATGAWDYIVEAVDANGVASGPSNVSTVTVP